MKLGPIEELDELELSKQRFLVAVEGERRAMTKCAMARSACVSIAFGILVGARALPVAPFWGLAVLLALVLVLVGELIAYRVWSRALVRKQETERALIDELQKRAARPNRFVEALSDLLERTAPARIADPRELN